MNRSEETVIDIRDFLAELLFSWKRILLIIVIFAMISSCFGVFRTLRRQKANPEGQKEEEILEEEQALLVEEAKKELTSYEIEEVERLHDQLTSYVNYRKILQDDFSGHMTAYNDGTEDQVVKRVSYSLSSTLEGANNLFQTMALGIDDYKKIMEILPEAETLTAAYNYIYISSIQRNSLHLLNMGETAEDNPCQYLLNVDLVGNSRSICDEMEKVVEDAFLRELEQIRKIDPDAALTQIGEQYNGDISNYIASKQQTTFDSIQKVDTAINNLKINAIAKLSEKELAYYNLLSDPEKGLLPEEGETVSGEGRKKIAFPVKYLIAGAFLGAVFSCMVMLIRYLLNGKVKIGYEMEAYYHIPVISTVFFQGKRKGLFSGLIKKFRNADNIPMKKKIAMIASDLHGMVQNTEDNSVYLMNVSQEAKASGLITSLGRSISEKDSGCRVQSGTPLQDAEELDQLTSQKNVVLLVHLGKTKRADIEKLLGICSRHKVNVLGAIASSEL